MSNPWKPGQSGNPKGRPPKGRVLTDVLAKEINKVVTATGGERISGKRLLARAVAEGLLTGKIVLPVGVADESGAVKVKVYEVKGDGWIDLLKWLYAQVDGPPKAQLELSGDTKYPLAVVYVNDWRDTPSAGGDTTPDAAPGAEGGDKPSG